MIRAMYRPPTRAIVREVSPAIESCELTHMEREAIDLPKAQNQQKAYIQALKDLGLSVQVLPHGGFADGVFVEDTAIVLDEVAVITQMGALSRRSESASIEKALQGERTLVKMSGTGSVDGGDVLRIGKFLFVGLSTRTNQEGIDELKNLVNPYGYAVKAVPVPSSLHLKTACTFVGDRTLLLNPEWVEPKHFSDFRFIEVDPSEPFGANSILHKKKILYPVAFPKTRALLEERGLSVVDLETSEFLKAEAGLTCMSLIY